MEDAALHESLVLISNRENMEEMNAEIRMVTVIHLH